MVNEAVLQSIGERLRTARERAGFTLDQAAEQAGLSKAHLSRLESAERQPSLAALLDLAGVLRVSVGALLGESVAGAPIGIHTPGEARLEAGGLTIVAASGFSGATEIEALRITVSPDREPSEPARHRGEEWLYVRRGILRLEYDGDVHYLGPEASAHFDAQRAHRLGAEGAPVELLLVAANGERSVLNVHR